jgi:quercetin dioxygenase-like cupin family protein
MSLEGEPMLIQRWQASVVPTKEQIKLMFHNEGLEIVEENIDPNTKFQEHRHPFSEVRVIVEGELIFNVGGTQLLLRAGDRIEIPSNTKHWHMTQQQSALTYFSRKVF